MKLLIDECLSPEPAKLAHELGHGEALHVVWLKKSGWKDWQLKSLILAARRLEPGDRIGGVASCSKSPRLQETGKAFSANNSAISLRYRGACAKLTHPV